MPQTEMNYILQEMKSLWHVFRSFLALAVYIEELEDTKGAIRIRISKKNRQHNDQKRRTDNTMAKREGQTTQWPKEKDRQHNDQKRRTDNTMTKRKSTKKDLQNIHIKLKIE